MSNITYDCIHILDNFIDERSMIGVKEILQFSDRASNVSKAKGEESYRALGFSEGLFDQISKYSPPSIILKENPKYPIRAVFDPLMTKTQQTIERLWSREIFPEEFYSILGFKEGDSLKAHHDDIYNLKTNSGHPKRNVSSVLYLNDEYDGGELHFTKQKLKFKPKSGSLIIFPSSEQFTHHVTKVRSGIRFFINTLWCFK